MENVASEPPHVAAAPPRVSLLAVFAHPDDESLACGGLLAWCAAIGVKASLLCLTRGEGGPGAESGPANRAAELDAAARILGLADVTLLEHPDGMLPWVDAGLVEADIAAALDRLRPDVVVTFGEDGLYWHPDHIAVHERTTAAVAAAEARGGAAPALYYVTMPIGSMRAVVTRALEKAAGVVPPPAPPQYILGIDNVDAFGADAEPPTLVLDVRPFAARKLQAIRCHESQLTDCALTWIDEAEAPALLGVEQFRRARTGAPGESFLDRLGQSPA